MRSRFITLTAVILLLTLTSHAATDATDDLSIKAPAHYECPRCGQVKSEDKFSKNQLKKRTFICRACTKITNHQPKRPRTPAFSPNSGSPTSQAIRKIRNAKALKQAKAGGYESEMQHYLTLLNPIMDRTLAIYRNNKREVMKSFYDAINKMYNVPYMKMGNSTRSQALCLYAFYKDMERLLFTKDFPDLLYHECGELQWALCTMAFQSRLYCTLLFRSIGEKDNQPHGHCERILSAYRTWAHFEWDCQNAEMYLEGYRNVSWTIIDDSFEFTEGRLEDMCQWWRDSSLTSQAADILNKYRHLLS